MFASFIFIHVKGGCFFFLLYSFRGIHSFLCRLENWSFLDFLDSILLVNQLYVCVYLVIELFLNSKYQTNETFPIDLCFSFNVYLSPFYIYLRYLTLAMFGARPPPPSILTFPFVKNVQIIYWCAHVHCLHFALILSFSILMEWIIGDTHSIGIRYSSLSSIDHSSFVTILNCDLNFDFNFIFIRMSRALKYCLLRSKWRQNKPNQSTKERRNHPENPFCSIFTKSQIWNLSFFPSFFPEIFIALHRTLFRAIIQ